MTGTLAEKQCAGSFNKSSLPDNVSAFGSLAQLKFNSKARYVNSSNNSSKPINLRSSTLTMVS
jgi:hypothetical protein